MSDQEEQYSGESVMEDPPTPTNTPTATNTSGSESGTETEKYYGSTHNLDSSLDSTLQSTVCFETSYSSDQTKSEDSPPSKDSTECNYYHSVLPACSTSEEEQAWKVLNDKFFDFGPRYSSAVDVDAYRYPEYVDDPSDLVSTVISEDLLPAVLPETVSYSSAPFPAVPPTEGEEAVITSTTSPEHPIIDLCDQSSSSSGKEDEEETFEGSEGTNLNVEQVSNYSNISENKCFIKNVKTVNNNKLYFARLNSVGSVKSSCVENPPSLSGLKNDLIVSKMELVYSDEIALSSIIKKGEDNLFSVRDLALASTSSQDIQFIDDEDCLEPALYEATPYKTDTEESKIIKTLSERTIIEIEDLIKSLAASTSYSFFYNTFNKSPSKSNLKRKLSTQGTNDKKTLKKSELKFTNVTIFYFERTQGFCSVPSKGGSTLGMSGQHFYITTLPIDDYEHKKNLKRLPMQKHRTIIYKRSDSVDTTKSIEALSIMDRVHILESSQVQIEISEENDCSHIRTSRALAGCDCKEYCYPDTCNCNMSGIECQVDRPNFPCGCSRENCKNTVGRNEYNPKRVKNHFIKTMRKIKYEHKSTTRSSKRKQSTPNKVLINEPEFSLIHT